MIAIYYIGCAILGVCAGNMLTNNSTSVTILYTLLAFIPWTLVCIMLEII